MSTIVAEQTLPVPVPRLKTTAHEIAALSDPGFTARQAAVLVAPLCESRNKVINWICSK